MKLIKITTSKSFTTLLFNNIINNKNLTKSPIKLQHSILISSKDLELTRKITERLELPLKINK